MRRLAAKSPTTPSALSVLGSAYMVSMYDEYTIQPHQTYMAVFHLDMLYTFTETNSNPPFRVLAHQGNIALGARELAATRRSYKYLWAYVQSHHQNNADDVTLALYSAMYVFIFSVNPVTALLSAISLL